MADEESKARANPGYALGQLSRAFTTSQEHADAAVRKRAADKIKSWTRVFEGMLSGALEVGSRTPVAKTPAWATLRVIKGGFATGELLAAGDLQEHERELIARLGSISAGTERAALNSYYLGEEGLSQLQNMLESGCYRIKMPEEGALLAVAWLIKHGQIEKATSVLDEIGPFFSTVRFYPLPDARPQIASSLVRLQDVSTVSDALSSLKSRPILEKQREAIAVWIPLYDRCVTLWAETIENDWPCQTYPPGWSERATTLLADYHLARVHHQKCSKSDRARPFAFLRQTLEVCLKDPAKLTGKQVGLIRLILKSIEAKRGLPGSQQCQQLREWQKHQVARPRTEDVASLLIHRLMPLPQREGLDSLDEVLKPVSEEESKTYCVTAGQIISENMTARLARCLNAPLSVLLEKKLIASGEVLARVIPQISSQVRAAGIADADLRRLYAAIYSAFRNRRSLLLLNLESQVRLDELPWIKVLEDYRKTGDGKQTARQTLEEVILLAVTTFPQQILPNKLLQEVRALSDSAGLDLPIVDELAADIFMGEFSEKYLQAARKSAQMLEGTLYENYYGISYERVRKLKPLEKPTAVATFFAPVAQRKLSMFSKYCMELSGENLESPWSVARNGKIIEQEQILTGHNLCVLFEALSLRESLGSQLGHLARRCFEWICYRQQVKCDKWQARLRTVKNCAYAWRQMMFFLALMPAEEVGEFLDWAQTHLQKQSPAFIDSFMPALNGLLLVAAGESLDHLSPDKKDKALRFLGWTTERHWLMAESVKTVDSYP